MTLTLNKVEYIRFADMPNYCLTMPRIGFIAVAYVAYTFVVAVFMQTDEILMVRR